MEHNSPLRAGRQTADGENVLIDTNYRESPSGILPKPFRLERPLDLHLTKSSDVTPDLIMKSLPGLPMIKMLTLVGAVPGVAESAALMF
jgi:hypothetical protein